MQTIIILIGIVTMSACLISLVAGYLNQEDKLMKRVFFWKNDSKISGSNNQED